MYDKAPFFIQVRNELGFQGIGPVRRFLVVEVMGRREVFKCVASAHCKNVSRISSCCYKAGVRFFGFFFFSFSGFFYVHVSLFTVAGAGSMVP